CMGQKQANGAQWPTDLHGPGAIRRQAERPRNCGTMGIDRMSQRKALGLTDLQLAETLPYTLQAAVQDALGIGAVSHAISWQGRAGSVFAPSAYCLSQRGELDRPMRWRGSKKGGVAGIVLLTAIVRLALPVPAV